jgi:hypothetical protein
MLVTGILSITNMFFDFGGRRNKHLEYSGKFSDFSTRAEKILSTRKRFREACDVTMECMRIEFSTTINDARKLA